MPGYDPLSRCCPATHLVTVRMPARHIGLLVFRLLGATLRFFAIVAPTGLKFGMLEPTWLVGPKTPN